MILGLTGGIGSGKSTVSKIFLSMGLKIFDADLIAKNILERDDIKEEVAKKLGKKFINLKDNSIKKELLKKEIFSNNKKLDILNSIVHPRVLKVYEELFFKYCNRGEIVIFDVPLLFEVNLEKYCNKVIVVDIEPKLQIERVKNRGERDEKLIEKIISSQMSRVERNLKADIILENNGTLDELKVEVKKIIDSIERGEK